MRGAQLLRLWLVMVLALAGSALAAPASRPAPATRPTGGSRSTPASRPSAAPKPTAASRPAAAQRPTPAARRALAKAIDELTERATRDPAGLATQSYFERRRVDGLTPQMVLDVLRGPLGVDIAIQCAVKQQLLTALPATLDGSQTEALLGFYRTAPPPLPRPGLTQADRRQWDQRLQRARQRDVEGLELALGEQVAAVEAANKSIVGYRDALFARLPASHGKFAAGLEDLWARADAGADPRLHLRSILTGVRGWAASAEPDELADLAERARSLRSRQPAEYVNSVEWDDTRHRAAARVARQSLRRSRELDELITALAPPRLP